MKDPRPPHQMIATSHSQAPPAGKKDDGAPAKDLTQRLESLILLLLPPDPKRPLFGSLIGLILASVVALVPILSLGPVYIALVILGGLTLISFLLFLAWRLTPREMLSSPDAARTTLPPQQYGDVCVFYPDRDSDPEHEDDPFYQDGTVQKRAFVAAKEQARVLGACPHVEFYGMRKDVRASELLKRMKERYLGGCTFFVMTMSSKVWALQDDFSAWHKECRTLGHPAPVLVATVASAPGLARIDGGIVRWYVRTQEESAKLARFVQEKFAACHSIAFLIDASPGPAGWESGYAKEAATAFQERFSVPDDGQPTRFLVTKDTAKQSVRNAVDRMSRWSVEEQKRTAAFVVGYGDMVRETLLSLAESGFQGPIACTSTLTQREWQPPKGRADERIFTVLPMLSGGRGHVEGADRDVVRFFAKNTLFRVLTMARKSRSSEEFLKRWAAKDFDNAGNPNLAEEVEATGDIRVDVGVVGHQHWRQ